MAHLKRTALFFLAVLFCTSLLKAAVLVDFNFIDPSEIGFKNPNNAWAKKSVYEAGAVFG